jgi:hypothetical protein
MEVAGTSETSVNFHQIARRNNSEDSHTRRRENLKSHLLFRALKPWNKQGAAGSGHPLVAC